MATRTQFSREFKVEAVKLVTERGVGVSQAARDLDVGRRFFVGGSESFFKSRNMHFLARAS